MEALSATVPAQLFTFPAGEQYKTKETWADLTDGLASAGFGRDAVVIAVGGGVVGDVAGFVAATYMRGISYVQVPTTLLAMIDSSIGGKTGIDTRFGKNMVGTFHQPQAVITDVSTLETLQPREFAAGVAEALKHGAIADPAYLEFLSDSQSELDSRDSTRLLELVRRSIEIKGKIVADDELEAGRRSILNFGHTIGHGIEAASDYKLLHGEAVAAGMVLEAVLGESLGITEAGTSGVLARAVSNCGLRPSLDPSCKPATVMRHVEIDKKKQAGKLRFSLLRRIGQPARGRAGEWTIEVPRNELEKLLASAA